MRNSLTFGGRKKWQAIDINSPLQRLMLSFYSILCCYLFGIHSTDWNEAENSQNSEILPLNREYYLNPLKVPPVSRCLACFILSTYSIFHSDYFACSYAFIHNLFRYWCCLWNASIPYPNIAQYRHITMTIAIIANITILISSIFASSMPIFNLLYAFGFVSEAKYDNNSLTTTMER